LRKVEIEAADYAWHEDGVTAEEIAGYERKMVQEHNWLKKEGKLEYLTAADLRKLGEKAN
jgi:hypothetical protein